MTKEQLNEINACFVGSRLKPNLYIIPFIGETNIYPLTTILDILEKAYESGKEDGIKEGKSLKIKEIKKVLEIENENE